MEELSMCHHVYRRSLLASYSSPPVHRPPVGRVPLAVGVLRFAAQADPEEVGLLALGDDKLLSSGDNVGQGFTHQPLITTAALRATPSGSYHSDGQSFRLCYHVD